MVRRSVCVGLALVLAALLLPALAQAQPDQRCFSETGLCINGRIRQFWEQNGGLPVFGLPIMPQQQEMIEGKPLEVQWFERNRLELHPENQRPYDVLLGRLGAARLTQQGRDPFQLPTSTQQPGCRFFTEMQHNVCGDVLVAWRASGLELDGRRGKSEPENLALFGLPLSDPLQETLGDGKAYTVQYFERARFELHPENAPPYNVLLGLLGAEVRGNGAPAQPPAPTPQPPTPAPAPQPQAPVAVTLSGHGQTVTDLITLPAAINRVTFTHNGRSNFIVKSYAPDGEAALLVNAIGAYRGFRPLEGTGGGWRFEINADGDWTVVVEPLGSDESAAGGTRGFGDTVSGLFTPPRQGATPYQFTHDGHANFIVYIRCKGGWDLAQNEIGPVNGSAMVEFAQGPCYWDVEADGAWSIAAR